MNAVIAIEEVALFTGFLSIIGKYSVKSLRLKLRNTKD